MRLKNKRIVVKDIEESQYKKSMKYAFVKSLPVMAGYIVLGIGFGVLLADKGYSVWWAVLMSLTIYAGSLQYVGVGLLSSGAGLLSAAMISLMVNARHLFYGISMLKPYEKTGLKKWYLIFGLTDETYSLVCAEHTFPEGVEEKEYYFWVTLLNQCYWILGSLIGALLGNTLSFNSAGIDFSMTALFVIIFVEQWEKAKNHLPAVAGLVVSIICLLIFGTENFLIPSMLGIVLGLFLFLKMGVLRND